MTTVVVFQLDGQPVSIVIPTSYNPFKLTIEEIGEQAVPAGVPFWVVDSGSLPADRTFRDAWVLDTDLLGAASGVGNPDKINQKIASLIEEARNALVSGEEQ